jgi:putative RNA 2'-phosphotransferase
LGRWTQVTVKKDQVKLSKFLSLVLRHEPERIGVRLDPQGWAVVSELLNALNAHGVSVTLDQLKNVVETNDKKRFALSDDGRMIRASQGHSVEVELGYERATPPPTLYHGTIARVLDSIMREGLRSGERHDVHLSAHVETARKVGSRRGKAIILQIDSERMHSDGFTFCVSANGVWLTRHVPSQYLKVDDSPGD